MKVLAAPSAKALFFWAIAAVGIGLVFINSTLDISQVDAPTTPQPMRPDEGAVQASTARIKLAIPQHTDDRYRPDAVAATPIPGVYEVRVGLELFYTDTTGRYAFVEGHLLDLANKKDMTQERLDQIATIKFDELPLHLALKTVRGNGKRVLAVFEDPHCPICRSFHKFLAQLSDVTIHTFIYPVLSAESEAAATAAWCASNRTQAWEALMTAGAVPETRECETPFVQIVSLGHRLNVRGTPTVFFGNGRRVHGAVPPDQFLAMLDEFGTP